MSTKHLDEVIQQLMVAFENECHVLHKHQYDFVSFEVSEDFKTESFSIQLRHFLPFFLIVMPDIKEVLVGNLDEHWAFYPTTEKLEFTRKI